jgi:hypothetical protein
MEERDMKKGTLWLAALLLVTAASCGPRAPEGPLSNEEQGLAGEYYRSIKGVVPANDQEISQRVQRVGAKKEEADQLVEELKKALDVPDQTLTLKADRTYEMTFGKGRSQGSWWASQGIVTLLAPKTSADRNPLSQGQTFRLRSDEAGSLTDIEGGEPYRRRASP